LLLFAIRNVACWAVECVCSVVFSLLLCPVVVLLLSAVTFTLLRSYGLSVCVSHWSSGCPALRVLLYMSKPIKPVQTSPNSFICLLGPNTLLSYFLSLVETARALFIFMGLAGIFFCHLCPISLHTVPPLLLSNVISQWAPAHRQLMFVVESPGGNR